MSMCACMFKSVGVVLNVEGIDPLLSAGTSASGPRVTIRTRRPDDGQATFVAP